MKTAYVIVLVMLSLALAACAGFDLGDVVRVQTPPAVQQTAGLPASMSVNEAEAEYRIQYERTADSFARWKGNIERGNEIRGLLNQLALGALSDYGPALAGIPVLGPALPALTGLAGLFLGVGRLRKEKEASYNAGLETGSALREV